MRDYSLPGVWKCLRRAGIRYKRGRDYVHSPDPEYKAKEKRIQEALEEAHRYYGRVVLLYGDEKSYFRQPSIGYDYSPKGPFKPLARRSHRSNTMRRIVGAVDGVTGRVLKRQASKVGIRVFKEFLRDVKGGYPLAEKLYLVLDNWWTVHDHPQVRELAVQLGITILFLPTYSPWLNPIEKLWRWLGQEVLHLHRLAEDWLELQAQVDGFLERFKDGGTSDCQSLLHYVGLAPYKNVHLSC